MRLAILGDHLFDGVSGDNRPFIACIVVLGQAAWERLAAELHVDTAAPASLQAPAARDAALHRIRELTRRFPHHALPRAAALSLESWTIEDTLITPTLKLKLNNLAARFATQIEQLYKR